MKITPKQMQALRDYSEGRECPDYDDYYGPAGALADRNRDRVISALQRRGLIDADQKITEAGRDMVAGRMVNTECMSEAQFAVFAR